MTRDGASGAKLGGSDAKIRGSGDKIGNSGSEIGGPGAKIRGSGNLGLRLNPLGLRLAALGSGLGALEPRSAIMESGLRQRLVFGAMNMGSEAINGDSRAKIEICGVKMGNSGAKIWGSESQIGAFEPQPLAQ